MQYEHVALCVFSMVTAKIMNMQSDSDLIVRILAGDANAFSDVVSRYRSKVYATAMRTCRSAALSEDVCQETFVSAWRNIAKLDDASKLCAWLCSIARNRAFDALRRRRREVLSEDGTIDGEEEATIDAPSPLTQSIDLEQMQTMMLALHTLPPNYRDPLILLYERGASAKQIARTLDLKVDAVKQRLHRGKALLRAASSRISACASGAETGIVPLSELAIDSCATLPL